MPEQERHIGRARTRLATHELVFRLRDPSFRSYMLMEDTNSVSPRELLRLSTDLAGSAHAHPLIQYAAGWAAAGAALHRDRLSAQVTHQFPIEERQGALVTASRMWMDAEGSFRDAGAAAASEPEVAADFLGFELRASQAVAYLPLMRLVANWFTGVELPEGQITTAIQQSKESLVALATRIVGLPSKDKYSNMSKSGMYSELLSGLLPLSDPAHQVVVLPASVQQDNNPNEDLRADLIAVSTGLHHPDGFIQVTADPDIKKGKTKRRLYVRAYKDLVLSPNQRPYHTLRAFLDRENGSLENLDISIKLDDLSRELSGRMYQFARGY